ncbi:MAG: iron-sulfur cluster assembly scaffold protein [Verrucomicrobia bacterium]|nr:iron-sulfur cluster assembly scaffold protein [Verrucomicrobiota bacterium]MCH8512062.1 iron-sulfur cluster assembly scaffold protein [Kiritimatiellia bacterium]
MYQNHLIQLSKDSAFREKIKAGEARSEIRNPACGDELALAFDLVEDTIRHIRHDSQACAIVLASTRVLCGGMEGATVALATRRVEEAMAFFEGEGDWAQNWAGEDMVALGAVRAHPMRMACVRLPWEAMRKALT